MEPIVIRDETVIPRKHRALQRIMLVCFGILFLRLYQLQLLSHTEFWKKSEVNSIRPVPKEAVRGYMYDREGKLVVDVGPLYTITITPYEFDTTNLPLLCSLIQVSKETILERLARGRAYSPFVPVKVKRDVDFRTLSLLEEYSYLLPGVGYEIESKREYHGGIIGSHLLGYCKEVSEAQLQNIGSSYRLGDVIGATGLEAKYERYLRGEKGYSFLLVNSRGQVIGPYEGGKRDILPKEGYDLLLTIDSDLQVLAESLMTGYRGAVVALDPNDGSILALVSKPDFDLRVLSGVTPAEVWNSLNANPEKPLFNRATMTRYPPGSTFKMLVAIAALDDGVIDESTVLSCSGGFVYGNKLFKDLHVHGRVEVKKAIQQSCNVFFYQLALKVGLQRLYEYGKKFGFGQPTGVDLAEETVGLLPSVEYYDRVYGKGKWTLGYIVSLGVGQGEIGVSPLQMARYTAALANGGILVQPHAVSGIYNKHTRSLELIQTQSKPIGIHPEVLTIVREGMRRVVEEPGGTGGMARIPGVVSAGKTGTAENPHGKDHAWYIGFAPFNAPKIAIAVMVENAGFGGAVAAPIAGKIIQRYLEKLQLSQQHTTLATNSSTKVQ
ncbi:MAG: penicillin-binding protein 2 [Bacteroidetes bacterium]|nr:penicillin-binding protein 2 [Bacteroidota bacterium]